jgi:voltage-gated potassium channel
MPTTASPPLEAAPYGRAPSGRRGVRAVTYRILDSRHFQKVRGGRTVNAVLLTIIALNIVALILESEPGILDRFATGFRLIEIISVAIFTIEYVARVWASVEDPRYADGIRGRLRYMTSPMAAIDLLAVAPFYLGGFADLRFLRSFRLLRIFRIAKAARYSVAMEIFGRVIASKRAELTIVLGFLVVLVLCFGSMMHLIEGEAQPERFGSITSAMWWAVVTLTTIGYGDTVPITMAGRAIGSVVAVFGIGLFALPAGMLGSAFAEAIAARNRQAGACPTCGGRNGARDGPGAPAQ